MAVIINNNNQEKRKSPQISLVGCVHTNNSATILRHHFLLKRSLVHEQHWNIAIWAIWAILAILAIWAIWAIWAISLTVKPLVLCRNSEVRGCGTRKTKKTLCGLDVFKGITCINHGPGLAASSCSVYMEQAIWSWGSNLNASRNCLIIFLIAGSLGKNWVVLSNIQVINERM